MKIDLQWQVTTAVQPSPNVLQVAAMFGLGIDQTRCIQIIPPVTLDIEPGHVILITGASGSGKSSLLRLIAEELRAHPQVNLVRFDQLPALTDRPLVDCFEDIAEKMDLEKVLQLLSLAGLNDAFVMLRRPSELSDGQRYRLRLAQTMAMIEAGRSAQFPVILADEFGATLDRITAKVIARNVRKWTHKRFQEPLFGEEGATRRQAPCFIVATTHDDLLEALEPDTLVEKHLGEGIEIATRGDCKDDA